MLPYIGHPYSTLTYLFPCILSTAEQNAAKDYPSPARSIGDSRQFRSCVLALKIPPRSTRPTRMHGLSPTLIRGVMRARRLKALGCSRVATNPAIGAKPNMLTILVVILLLVALGALPTWPHSRGWGYYPSGGLGLVVLILVILLIMGRI